MIGIYMIKNNLTGHCYVGQSVDIRKRWIDHKTPSKRNRGMVLGRALSKYGAENFSFVVLEECSESDLNEREMHYIAKLRPAYNMNEGGLGNRGHRLSQEAKNKLSLLGKQQWHSKTEAEKRDFVKTNLKGPRKGHSVSEETREKLRASAKRQFANGMPEYQRQNISKALKGKKKPIKSSLNSVETIPQGSRAEDELPLEVRSNFGRS
jgi:group I intron endonuclease